MNEHRSENDPEVYNQHLRSCGGIFPVHENIQGQTLEKHECNCNNKVIPKTQNWRIILKRLFKVPSTSDGLVFVLIMAPKIQPAN